MISDDLKELEAARAKVAELEKNVAAQLDQELVSLPAKFGFADLNSFIAALKSAAGVRRKTGVAKEKSAKTSEPGTRRKRSVITDATRAEVKTMVEAGKTGAEIALALGISLPSVQNIKKALGLVKQSNP
jgi:DNA-binding CsgD family transcriptional regulator